MSEIMRRHLILQRDFSLLRRPPSPTVLPPGAFAVRTVCRIIARLVIANDPDGFFQFKQPAAGPRPQQGSVWREGQRLVFFLISTPSAQKNDPQKRCASCGDASPATSAFHSDPCPLRLCPLPAHFRPASAG